MCDLMLIYVGLVAMEVDQTELSGEANVKSNQLPR